MKYLSDKVIEFINGGSMKVQTYLLYVPIQTVDLNMNDLTVVHSVREKERKKQPKLVYCWLVLNGF